MKSPDQKSIEAAVRAWNVMAKALNERMITQTVTPIDASSTTQDVYHAALYLLITGERLMQALGPARPSFDKMWSDLVATREKAVNLFKSNP